MSKPWLDIHPDFRLNGIRYEIDDLWDVGYSLVKEGEAHEASIGNFLLQWLDSKDTIAVRTSGSTGTPKVILLRKGYMLNSARTTGDFFVLQPKMKALLCLSSDFIAGKMMLVRAMILGLDLYCVTPGSNPLEGLTSYFDFCAMAPLQVEQSFQKLNQIGTLIVGGAPVSGNLAKKIQDTECSAFETYGMTETITHIAARPIVSDRKSFKVLPGIEISTDSRDCLVINAPKLGVENLVTNDLVRIISAEAFEWLGRFDNVINSGGIKLIPESIEAKLAPMVENRFFVSGLPDETLGQKLVLVVEGPVDLNLKRKIAFLTILSRYETPKEIYFITKFIETRSGKISRFETLKELVS